MSLTAQQKAMILLDTAKGHGCHFPGRWGSGAGHGDNGSHGRAGISQMEEALKACALGRH